MGTIVTLTLNPAVDKSTAVDQVIPERKLRCDSPRFEPGGGGINVSRAIKQLGGDSLALYTAGGPAGNLLQGLLDREGIDHRPFKIRGSTRQNLIVYEKSSGQQYRFGLPGPVIREEEWRICYDAVKDLDQRPEYVVASGSLPPGVPPEFYGRLAMLAKDLGVRLVVDTSGEPFRYAVEQGVFLIKPNLRELGILADRSLERESDQLDAAQQVVLQGKADAVVVSLGSAGALVVWKDGHERLRSPTVPIRSKVGAGDSMVGGIVLALSRGESLLEAARFGVAAGAAAVMTPGTGLCRREDTERLYRELKDAGRP